MTRLTAAQLEAHDRVAQLAAEWRAKQDAMVRAAGFRKIQQDQTPRGEYRRGKHGREFVPTEERPLWMTDDV